MRALDGVTVQFANGVSTPPSWARRAPGKSTLMHCVAGLDTLTSGQVLHRRRRPVDPQRAAAHAAAPRQGRLHLPGLQPDPDAQRHARTSRCPWTSPAASPTRRGSTAWSTPSAWRNRLVAPADGAVRWPAAARRRGPRPRQPARDHLRRRAHRQPRQPRRRRDPRVHAQRGRRARPDDRDGHPRSRRPRATPTASCSSPTAASSTRWPSPPPTRVLDRLKRFGE